MDGRRDQYAKLDHQLSAITDLMESARAEQNPERRAEMLDVAERAFHAFHAAEKEQAARPVLRLIQGGGVAALLGGLGVWVRGVWGSHRAVAVGTVASAAVVTTGVLGVSVLRGPAGGRPALSEPTPTGGPSASAPSVPSPSPSPAPSEPGMPRPTAPVVAPSLLPSLSPAPERALEPEPSLTPSLEQHAAKASPTKGVPVPEPSVLRPGRGTESVSPPGLEGEVRGDGEAGQGV